MVMVVGIISSLDWICPRAHYLDYYRNCIDNCGKLKDKEGADGSEQNQDKNVSLYAV